MGHGYCARVPWTSFWWRRKRRLVSKVASQVLHMCFFAFTFRRGVNLVQTSFWWWRQSSRLFECTPHFLHRNPLPFTQWGMQIQRTSCVAIGNQIDLNNNIHYKIEESYFLVYRRLPRDWETQWILERRTLWMPCCTLPRWIVFRTLERGFVVEATVETRWHAVVSSYHGMVTMCGGFCLET